MSHHPLVQRLVERTAARAVGPDTVEDFEADPGVGVLFLAGDPVRFPESLDVAVVLPELQAGLQGRLRVGVVPREHEDAVARRYAVQRWPSLVFLRDGGYLGTVSGMQDWDVYLREVGELLSRVPAPRPRPAIAIRAADGGACH